MIRQDSSPCSCVDCPTSCPVVTIQKQNDGFLLFGLNGYGIVTAIAIVALILIFIIVYIIKIRGFHCDFLSSGKIFQIFFTAWGKSTYVSSMTFFFYEISLPLIFSYFLFRTHLTMYKYKCFIRFLTVFAKYPIIFLLVFVYIIVRLSFGIKYLSITSNPIEIWAAPTSRARIEKNYFDSHFQPFYRTEQVYIKSVGLDKVKSFSLSLSLFYIITHIISSLA